MEVYKCIDKKNNMSTMGGRKKVTPDCPANIFSLEIEILGKITLVNSLLSKIVKFSSRHNIKSTFTASIKTTFWWVISTFCSFYFLQWKSHKTIRNLSLDKWYFPINKSSSFKYNSVIKNIDIRIKTRFTVEN